MLNGMPKLKEILFYLFYACLYAGMLKKNIKISFLFSKNYSFISFIWGQQKNKSIK
jgi:hypothetical protein